MAIKPHLISRNTTSTSVPSLTDVQKGEIIMGTTLNNEGLWIARADNTLTRVGFPMTATTGTSATAVMSQNAITEALSKKINTSEVVETSGTSKSLIMSQNAVTEALKCRTNSTRCHADKVISFNPEGTSTFDGTFSEGTCKNVAEFIKNLYEAGAFQQDSTSWVGKGNHVFANSKQLLTEYGYINLANSVIETCGFIDSVEDITDEKSIVNVFVRITTQTNFPSAKQVENGEDKFSELYVGDPITNNTFVLHFYKGTNTNGTYYDRSTWTQLGSQYIKEIPVTVQRTTEERRLPQIVLSESTANIDLNVLGASNSYFINLNKNIGLNSINPILSLQTIRFNTLVNSPKLRKRTNREWKFYIKNTLDHEVVVRIDGLNSSTNIDRISIRPYELLILEMFDFNKWEGGVLIDDSTFFVKAEIIKISNIPQQDGTTNTDTITKGIAGYGDDIEYITLGFETVVGGRDINNLLPTYPIKNKTYRFIINNNTPNTQTIKYPNDFGRTTSEGEATIKGYEVGEVSCLYTPDGKWFSKVTIVG